MGQAVIFFDIDGTLCRYGDTVTREVRDCFGALHRAGNAVFLCTGRSPADISQDILSLGFDGIIACMGAVILLGGEVVRNEFIPPELLLETVEAMLVQEVPALILGISEVLRTGQMAPTALETGVVRSVEDLYRDGRPVHISTLDIEYPRVSALGPIRELIGRHSKLIEYTPRSGQTALLGMNKAGAIKKIMGMPAYAGLKSYAIGDSQNDIEMLEYVDVGIAMGDAPDLVKAAADWCTATVEENGVCEAMGQFGLM